MHGWTRRDALKVTAGAALASMFGCGDDATPIAGPRNILLITGDDLGWKDLSAAGNPNLATSNLDRIASAGVSFRNAFDVTSSCSSSRATFATGQYPQTHGVVGLVHRFPELSLPEGTPTLASHLVAAGFVTAIEGKFHLAFPQTADAYGYQEVMTSLLAQRIEVAVQAQPALRLLERAGESPLQQLDGEIEIAELRVGAGGVVEHEEVVRLERQRLGHPRARSRCLAERDECGGAEIGRAGVVGVPRQLPLHSPQRRRRFHGGLCPAADGIRLEILLQHAPAPAQIAPVARDRRILDSAFRLGGVLGLNMIGPVEKPARLDELETLLRGHRPIEAE